MLTRCFTLLLIGLGGPSWALTPMSDDSLSAVAGQDGLSINLSNPGQIEAASVNTTFDKANANRVAEHQLSDVALYSHSFFSGSPTPLNVDVEFDVGEDSGGQPAAALMLDWRDLSNPAEAALTEQSDWLSRRPLVLEFGGGTTSGFAGNTYGRMGLVSAGYLKLTNRNGLLNAGYDGATMDLRTIGDWIYTQPLAAELAPELSFGNLDFSLTFTDNTFAAPGTGTFGVDADGLVISAPYMDLALNFDLLFKANPTRRFDTSNRGEMILFGWEGGITGVDVDEDGTFERDALVRVSPGGYGYGTIASGGLTYHDLDGTNTPLSGGLNVLTEWDYAEGFTWILGQAGGNRTRVNFFDWQRLPGAPVDFRLPLIVDVFRNGEGPGGICFGGALPSSGSLVQSSCEGGTVGGTYEELALEGDGALGVLIRDGRLHAYNTRVEVVDPGQTPASEIFNWSLLYTYGKIDSNIMLYPQGRGAWNGTSYDARPSGVKADVVLAMQSPGYWESAQSNFAVNDVRGNWATHTHFGIADTNTANPIPIPSGGTSNRFAFGLLNADLLWKVDDLFIRVVDSDSVYTDFPGGFWLHSDNLAQYQFRGVLGGGSLDDMSRLVNIAFLDINLSTDNFLFALSPGPSGSLPGQTFIGFDGRLDLDGNAYISIAEPSQPQADVRFGDVSGSIRWKDGKIQVASAAATPSDPRPRLTIANDLLIGSTVTRDTSLATPTQQSTTYAGPVAGEALVGQFSFSGDNWMRMAIPAGHWESRISLKKQ